MAKVLPLWVAGGVLLISEYSISANDTQIEYQVPVGFAPSEQDDSMQFLGTLDGRALPGVINWSASEKRLIFDDELYRKNDISDETIHLLKSVLSDVPYTTCQGGCDYITNGQMVKLDKVNQSLAIYDNKNYFYQPETGFGFVHNQSVDIRTASNNYRAVAAYGQGYLGLPSQSYGHFSWFYNDSKNSSISTQDRGLSTWFLQKNFSSVYVRTGRQDSLDFAAGSVSTSLNPSLDKFLTIGSQDNLKRDNKSAGKLILFANSEGDYEFYRDGRLIRRLPAVLGRNEIDYNQLPGGFFSVEIRLVNRNGQIVNREEQQIANVNYGNSNGWYLTVGNELKSQKSIINAGASFQTMWFAASSALIKGQGNEWVVEQNATRPMQINDIDFTPTAGLMAGEKNIGGYMSLQSGNQKLGYLAVSQYQNTSVSAFYPARNSSSLSYYRQFYKARIGYNYNRYSDSEQHQIQSTWNFHSNGIWAVISTGIQKGGLNYSNNNFGLFVNTTIMLNQNTGTLNAAYYNNKMHIGGSYTQELEDSFGTTYAGVDFSDLGRTGSVGLNARRSGSRGESSVRIGINDKITNGSFNYNGMFAVSKEGFALGRTSNSGAAMLVTTPNLGDKDYGFKVEGNPVASNGTYAVPLSTYQNLSFAKAQTVDSDIDMNIRLPANIVRAHPGQVYPVKAHVEMSLLYNGFLQDNAGNPVSGTVIETGDTVYPNGLFSIASSILVKQLTVDGKHGRYRCDMTKPKGKFYSCSAN